MNCDEVEELIGAYVLGALPFESLSEIGEHLLTCGNHPDTAELRAVASSLAFAAPEREAPPALRTRLMDAVRGDAQPAASARDRRGVFAWLRGLTVRPVVSYGLAGALAVSIAALVVTNVGDSTTPDGATVALVGAGGAAGTVHLLEDDIVVMEVDGLDPLGADETYQVWAIDSGIPASLGLLTTAPDGGAVQALIADLSDADALAVTVEPAGGSFAPTTEPILQSEGPLRR